MYYYQVFEIVFASEIKLDLFKSLRNPDYVNVIVREGKNDCLKFSGDSFQESYGCRYNSQVCLFGHNLEYGTFCIRKKPEAIEVTIDFSLDKYKETLMSYFYGTGLAVILFYKKMFVLHASGVLHAGRLNLFCGRSGIGKSTLAAQLKTKGYAYFNDDKCILQNNERSEIVAIPGLQVIRLWQNSIDQLPYLEFLKEGKEVVYRKDKYQFKLDSEDIVGTPKKVNAIFIIKNAPSERNLAVIELLGIEKLNALKTQIFRLKMVQGLKLERELWDYVTLICSSIPVYLLKRPNGTSIEQFSSFVDGVLTHERSLS